MPISAVFFFCTGVSLNCEDKKRNVGVIFRTKIGLITMFFLVACDNGRSSHSIGYFQFGDHLNAIIAPLSTGVLQNVEMVGPYSVFHFVGYGLICCLLRLSGSDHIDWSCYSSIECALFFHDFIVR